ncbi:MAG: FG-GAP repeat protein [Dehalococcoidia bacterium]|nr:FG-GAP repeat protein [Dehalococcoidia bacterium]
MLASHRRLALLAGLIVTGLGAAACGGGSDSSSATTAATSGSASPTSSTPGAAGSPAASASLDLASASPLFTVLPRAVKDFRTGTSSLASGDFNGDGVADLLIGMRFDDGPDNSREDAGAAYVIFGKQGLQGQLDLATDAPGLTIWGALTGDDLGVGVAAGDLNGDGIDDVIVGAPGSNGLANVRTDVGEAYVVFGRHDLSGSVDTLKVEQGFTLIAAEGFARVGTSFAVADVNDDRIPDLIAGAPFGGREPGSPPGGPRTTLGEVYVVFGRHDLQGGVSVAKDEQDFAMAGAVAQDAFGGAVAAGDVNDDGIADIIVGARGYDGPDGKRDSAGAAFVYFGSPALSGKRGVADADDTILGADVGDALGETLASGDVNGDGIADIVAVARSGDGSGNTRPESGEAHVMFGGRGLSGTHDLAAKAAGAAIYGPAPGGLLGTAVEVKDLDGDGRGDIILGSPLADGMGRSLSGIAYVVYAAGLATGKNLAGDLGGVLVVYGAEPYNALGTGTAVGDVNADGRPELMLMAAADQGSSQQRGKIYVLTPP